MEIISSVEKTENEKVFQKRYNSMFKETGLKRILGSTRNSTTGLIVWHADRVLSIHPSKWGLGYDYKLVIPEKGLSQRHDGRDIPAETLRIL